MQKHVFSRVRPHLCALQMAFLGFSVSGLCQGPGGCNINNSRALRARRVKQCNEVTKNKVHVPRCTFVTGSLDKGLEKAHETFSNINFLSPHPRPFGLSRAFPEKSLWPRRFLGKNAKEAHKQTFSGDFGGQKRGPERLLWAHKRVSLLSFSGLPLERVSG